MVAERPAIVRAQPTVPQDRFFHSEARFRAFVGGVGSGKTYAGALEALRQPAGSAGMVIAPTYPMLKDASLKTFMEIARPLVTDFHKGDLRMSLRDGKTILFRSSDNPDRLRGPNLGWVWLDEAAMMDPDTWDIVIGRLRLEPGRAWVTTTPRGHNWLYRTFSADEREGYDLIRSSSRENTYLPGHYVEELQRKYTAGFAKQEIEGEFVVMEGALWGYDLIERHRTKGHPELRRVVIGVDPAGGGPDEVGIVCCAEATDGHFYVLEDASMQGSPNAWAQAVATLAERRQADRVVAEKNYGGDMVASTLKTAAPRLPLKLVTASRGKALRAEPIAALYEQGMVHHVGGFARLEEQMTTWDPTDTRAKSPDRLDALVFALSELALKPRIDYGRP
jgi:phage terminase large subunit-like protein